MNHISASLQKSFGGIILMENKVFELTRSIIDNITSIEDVPFYFKDAVNAALAHYAEDNSEFYNKAKEIALRKAGAEFANRRDAIRWVNGLGYDCANEDITNFLASYIKLQDDYSKWVANGSQGDEPATYYKVYTDQTTMAKGVVPLTLDKFNQVYETVRTSQFEAYAWLETVRAQINQTHNYEELLQVLESANISL